MDTELINIIRNFIIKNLGGQDSLLISEIQTGESFGEKYFRVVQGDSICVLFQESISFWQEKIPNQVDIKCLASRNQVTNDILNVHDDNAMKDKTIEQSVVYLLERLGIYA